MTSPCQILSRFSGLVLYFVMVLGVLLVVTTLKEECYVVISFILGSFSFVLHPCAIPTYRAVALTSCYNATPTSVWQNEYANYSESVTMEPLSDFYRKLEPKMKARYLEKIPHIRKDDPSHQKGRSLPTEKERFVQGCITLACTQVGSCSCYM